jgi:hypothetical protein
MLPIPTNYLFEPKKPTDEEFFNFDAIEDQDLLATGEWDDVLEDEQEVNNNENTPTNPPK